MLGNTLLARPFDARNRRVTGEAIPIAEQVERNTDSLRGGFTVAQTGRLAYRRVGETELVWYDRAGRRLGTAGSPAHYRNPALSPDGERLAVGRLDPKTGLWGVWTFELSRGVASRFTLEPFLEDMPVWSPDGTQVAFTSTLNGIRGFYRRSATGAGESELVIGNLPNARHFTRGGRGFHLFGFW
jgi:dipeptidyl aminopeptidase/acylaminoacyl peptidase